MRFPIKKLHLANHHKHLSRDGNVVPQPNNVRKRMIFSGSVHPDSWYALIFAQSTATVPNCRNSENL